MNINFDWESIITSLFDFIKGIFNGLINLLQLPTTPYGLVKFIAKNNYIIFGNETLSKIVLYVTPFIVSMIITFLIKLLGVKKTSSIALKLTIIIYLVMLYLFSYIVTCIVIGSLIILLGIIVVIKRLDYPYYE